MTDLKTYSMGLAEDKSPEDFTPLQTRLSEENGLIWDPVYSQTMVDDGIRQGFRVSLMDDSYSGWPLLVMEIPESDKTRLLEWINSPIFDLPWADEKVTFDMEDLDSWEM